MSRHRSTSPTKDCGEYRPSSPTANQSFSPSYTPRDDDNEKPAEAAAASMMMEDFEQGTSRPKVDADSVSVQLPMEADDDGSARANPYYKSSRRAFDGDDVTLKSLREEISKSIPKLRRLYAESITPNLKGWNEYQERNCRGRVSQRCVIFCLDCFGHGCESCNGRLCQVHSDFLLDAKIKTLRDRRTRKTYELVKSCRQLKAMLDVLGERFEEASSRRNRDRDRARFARSKSRARSRSRAPPPNRGRSRARSRTPPGRADESNNNNKRARTTQDKSPEEMAADLDLILPKLKWSTFASWKKRNSKLESELDDARMSKSAHTIREPIHDKLYDVHVLLILREPKSKEKDH